MLMHLSIITIIGIIGIYLLVMGIYYNSKVGKNNIECENLKKASETMIIVGGVITFLVIFMCCLLYINRKKPMSFSFGG
jgi:glucose uptake protein GlcU